MVVASVLSAFTTAQSSARWFAKIRCFAAAYAGAARVVANDIDAWAALVTRIGADAQGLAVDTLVADLCAAPEAALEPYDVVLCSDLSYERAEAPRQRRVLDAAMQRGALVIAADAGRTYFDPDGLTLLAEYELDVPADLEGRGTRVARVWAGMRTPCMRTPIA